MINETKINNAYTKLYKEMVDTIKEYVNRNGGSIDTEIVYRYYDEELTAERIKRIYVKDGVLYWVLQDFDACCGYSAAEVDFDDDVCWIDEEYHHSLTNVSDETIWVSKFDIEVMDEIISWLNYYNWEE